MYDKYLINRQPHLFRRKAEQRGCLFLFGDAAESGDMAIIFLGPPGTGKTTTMHLLPEPWHELSQNLIVVLPDMEKTPRVTCWTALLENALQNPQDSWGIHHSPHLLAIFSLKRSSVESIKRLNNVESLGLLMEAIKRVWPDSTRGMPQIEALEHRVRRFDSLAWLAKSIPCYELEMGTIGACQKLIEKMIFQSS